MPKALRQWLQTLPAPTRMLRCQFDSSRSPRAAKSHPWDRAAPWCLPRKSQCSTFSKSKLPAPASQTPQTRRELHAPPQRPPADQGPREILRVRRASTAGAQSQHPGARTLKHPPATQPTRQDPRIPPNPRTTRGAGPRRYLDCWRWPSKAMAQLL